jgi:hypothetical protein
MYVAALLNYHNVTHQILSQTRIVHIYHCVSCLTTFSRKMSTIFNNNCRYRQSCIIVLKMCLVCSIFWQSGTLGFNFYYHTWLYSGINIFNKLPLEIKNIVDNQKKFKIALKKCLHTHSFYTIDEYLSQSGIKISIARYL